MILRPSLVYGTGSFGGTSALRGLAGFPFAVPLVGRGDQPFVARSAEQRLADAQAIAGSDFFELVRSTAVVEIYSDPQTWAAFGYEGPSFEKGGYIDRGFNDLAWLPDPEQEA